MTSSIAVKNGKPTAIMNSRSHTPEQKTIIQKTHGFHITPNIKRIMANATGFAHFDMISSPKTCVK